VLFPLTLLLQAQSRIVVGDKIFLVEYKVTANNCYLNWWKHKDSSNYAEPAYLLMSLWPLAVLLSIQLFHPFFHCNNLSITFEATKTVTIFDDQSGHKNQYWVESNGDAIEHYLLRFQKQSPSRGRWKSRTSMHPFKRLLFGLIWLYLWITLNELTICRSANKTQFYPAVRLPDFVFRLYIF